MKIKWKRFLFVCFLLGTFLFVLPEFAKSQASSEEGLDGEASSNEEISDNTSSLESGNSLGMEPPLEEMGKVPQADATSAEGASTPVDPASSALLGSAPDSVTNGGAEGKEQVWDNVLGREDTARIALDVTNGIRVKDIVQPSAEYHFASFGRPDPFLPQIRLNRQEKQILKEGDPEFEEIQVTSILQNYPVADLLVVGIWNPQNAARKALVNAPSGEGVVVQIGDPIGMKAGKVIGITDTYLSVREFEIAFDGTRQFQDLKLWINGKKPKEVAVIRLGPGNKTTSISSSTTDGLQNMQPASPMVPMQNQPPSLGPSAGGDPGMGSDYGSSTYSRKILGEPSPVNGVGAIPKGLVLPPALTPPGTSNQVR